MEPHPGTELSKGNGSPHQKRGRARGRREEGLRYPSFGAFTLIGSEAWGKWKKGPENYYIFNVDGSYNKLDGRAGIGGVLRNHIGLFLYGFFSNCVGYHSIRNLEIEAILRAVRKGWQMKIPRLIIQTDCAQAEFLINWAYIEPGRPFSAKIYEIRWYFAQKQTWDAKLISIKREGNLCSDFLAKEGAGRDIKLFEFKYLYSGVRSIGTRPFTEKLIRDGFFRRFIGLLYADFIGHWYQRFPNNY